MGKIRSSKIYWLIISCLPIIDSLNGMINGGGNKGGISLGIIYRFLVLSVSVYHIYRNRIKKKVAFFYGLFFSYLVLSVLISGGSMFSYLMILLRLVLPMILICAFKTGTEKGVIEADFISRLFEQWSWLFPVTMIIPYLLRIGLNTYGSNGVGYKAFYYAQNDIGYILALMYLFMIFQIEDRVTLKKSIIMILLLVSNLLLGLKSNYMFVLAITFFYAVRVGRKCDQIITKVFVIGMIISGTVMISWLYKEDIKAIMERWLFFYHDRSAVSFWTSSRMDRVRPSYDWLQGHMGSLGVFFGSGLMYTAHTVVSGSNFIEMDLLDIFFQLGMIGMIYVYGFYIVIQRKFHSSGFYFWGFLLSLASSSLAGHVMESALSGMVFAMLCCGAIAEGHKRKMLT